VKFKNIVVFVVFLTMIGCSLIDPEEPGALVPPTVDQDSLLPQMKIIVAGHTRSIHIQNFGDSANPALFILHGSASDFRPFVPLQLLSDKYFVVMWDQRGSGLPERITKQEITWDAVVEEIDQIKSHFSPQNPVTFIGHSY